MGIWDFFNSSAEAVKRNAPGLAPVKNVFTTSYNYGSAACTKIGNIFGVQRSKQGHPGDEAKFSIGPVATNFVQNAALFALHESCTFGPLLYRLAPGFLHRSTPVMNDDAVWILVCYSVEYEQSVEGVWNWKYTENGKGKTTPILVSETISYADLYDIIGEVLNVDTRLYKMKMSALAPIMRKAQAAPIIIDCDNNVKWFVSVCTETFLCVTISNEEVENHKEFGDEDVMDEDAVRISVCYPIEYEESVEGVWNLKYAGNDKEKVKHILVSKTVSYADLYDIIRDVLNVDTRLYKMKMSTLVPIKCKDQVAPIIIDCDSDVKWFVSVCRETCLCVTISNEEVENHKEFGDEDVYCPYKVKNDLDIMNGKDKHV